MRKRFFICTLILIFTRSVMAGESEKFEALIHAKKWRAAGLLMFDRAAELYPNSIPIAEMIKTGYSHEALARTEYLSGGNKAYILLQIARDSIELSYSTRLELLGRAEQEATEVLYTWVKSAISAAYLALGAEADARRVFTSIMSTPGVGVRDYRNLAESFERLASDVKIGPWVSDPLLAQLDLTEPGFNTAFAYQSVSLLYYRGGDLANARSALSRGLNTVKHIREGSSRRTARHALARTALEFGDISLARQYGESGALIADFALHAARTGNTQRALEILPDLGATLYVDHRGSAIDRIVQEALNRRDVVTAKTFIKLRPAHAYGTSALYWLQLAEIERSDHHTSEADAAIHIALAPYLEDQPHPLGKSDFSGLYRVAMGLMARGEADKAKLLSDRFALMIDAISIKIPKNYIKPRSLAAALCGRLKDFECSAREIMAAYDTLQLHISQLSNAGSPPSGYDMAVDYVILASALGTIALSSNSNSDASRQCP